MSNDLQPIHGAGLDQPLPIQEELRSEFDEIEQVLSKVDRTGDFNPAFDYGRRVIVGVQVKGIGLAKLLYELKQRWDTDEHEETFADRVFVEWGISEQTVNKYTNIWRSIFDNEAIPMDVRYLLAERPMRTLKRLAPPAADEEFTDEEWRELSRMSDHHEIVQFIEDKRGKPTTGKPRMEIRLNEETGQLVAWEDGHRSNLGVLRTSERDLEDNLRWRAIERIKRGAGVLPS